MINSEGCSSGLRGHFAKVLAPHGAHGFESHTFLQMKLVRKILCRLGFHELEIEEYFDHMAEIYGYESRGSLWRCKHCEYTWSR